MSFRATISSLKAMKEEDLRVMLVLLGVAIGIVVGRLIPHADTAKYGISAEKRGDKYQITCLKDDFPLATGPLNIK